MYSKEDTTINFDKMIPQDISYKPVDARFLGLLNVECTNSTEYGDWISLPSLSSRALMRYDEHYSV